MDVSAIPKLAKDTLSILRDLAIDIATLLERRGLKGAVIQVSDLSFHAGGMLRNLRKISSGEGSAKEIKELRQQLKTTEPEVEAIIKTLNISWTKLIRLPDGLEVANQIGDIIHSPIGKMGIRREIGEITKRDPKSPEAIKKAKDICDGIDIMNKRIVTLHERVLKPAAEIFRQRRK